MLRQATGSARDESVTRAVLIGTIRVDPDRQSCRSPGRDGVTMVQSAESREGESVRRHVRPGFPHLPHDPESIRISCHVETQNLSPVMACDKEAIQNAKCERRYREEVHGCNCLVMVPEECQPAFGGIWSSRGSHSASARGFDEGQAEFRESSRCAEVRQPTKNGSSGRTRTWTICWTISPGLAVCLQNPTHQLVGTAGPDLGEWWCPNGHDSSLLPPPLPGRD